MSWADILKYGASGLGLAAMIGASFFGKDRAPDQTSNVVNTVAPAADPGAAPALPSVDDYGGAKDLLVPSLTGVSNRENKWGVVPRCFGNPIRVFPALAAHPYSVEQGWQSTLRVVYEFGPGPLEISNIKIGDQPISAYPTITYQFQSGAAGDAPLTIYTNDVEQSHFSELLNIGTTNPGKMAGQKATTISVVVSMPDGIWIEENGVKRPAKMWISVVIAPSAGGAAVVVDNVEINVLSVGQYVWGKGYSVPDGLYTVSVGRYNPTSSVDPDLTHPAYWTSLAAWTNQSPFKDFRSSTGELIHMSRLGIEAVSNNTTGTLSGTLGELSAEVKSKLRTWDGSAWTAPVVSANPAWVMVEILTGAATYRRAPDSRIDVERFKAFADFCDAKGFTFNYPFDSETTVRQALDIVAAAGRGYFLENRNGKYSVGIDQPQETIAQHFTLRNIRAGSFQARVSYIEPPDYLSVKWINPAVNWQQDERKVYDDGKVEGVDFKMRELPLLGVTNAEQAYKLGRYQMAHNRLRVWVYQFATDIEHLTCEVGDKVRVTHEMLGWGLGQGRITAVTTNGGGDVTGITIDASQQMLSGNRYSVRIRLNSGASVVREVNVVEGGTKALAFTSVIASGDPLPVVGNMVMFGYKDNESAELLITSIEPDDDMGAVLTCVDYAPGVYTADTGSIPAFESQLSYPRKRETIIPVPTIVGWQSNESVLERDGAGTFRTRILITMGAVPEYVTQFEWQIQPVGGSGWSISSFVPAVPGAKIPIYDVEERKAYNVKIRARAGNYFGDWNESIQNYTVIGKTTPPPDIPRLVLREPNSNLLRVFYDADHGVTVPVDFAGIRVKVAWNAYPIWETGLVLADLMTGTTFDAGGLLYGVKCVMFKAVDVAGNEQAGEPAIIIADFGPAVEENIIVEIPHAPGFTIGTATDASVSGGTLVNNDDGGLFWGADDALFWGADSATFWGITNYVPATYTWKYTPPLSEAKPFKVMVGYSITGPFRLEYRVIGSGLYWGADGDYFWGADDELFWGDESNIPYAPVPDAGIDGDYVEYDFRLTFLPSTEGTVVSALTQKIDVADIFEYVDDWECTNPGGSRPPLTKTFRGIKSVRPTLQGSASHPDAVSYLVLDKNASGPLIQALDSAQAGTTGLFDLEIRGW